MGFDAMCYTRYSLPDGTIKVSFVMAGNRVAPLKQLSLPCLELQVAVLDVRLYCVVKQELTVVIKDTIFWSDSETVLQYTADKSRHFHTFMANRVSEIHDATDPTQGRHVSGHCNPAGNCTWGLGAANLDHNCWWLNGPAFLSKSVEYWPQDMLDPSLKMRKWKTQSGRGIHLLAIQERTFQTQRNSPLGQDFVMSLCGFVVLSKAVKEKQRITLHRLLLPQKFRMQRWSPYEKVRDLFHLDFEALTANKRLPVRTRPSTLNPYVDEAECSRVGGHLCKGPAPEQTRHSLILDLKHEITHLIVMQNHLHLYCASN